MEEEKWMKLADLLPGEYAKVLRIADPTVRAQAIRFGIAEGSQICCDESIPAGPVIVRRGMMQYAIGRNLARNIDVLPQIGQGKQASGHGGRRRHRWRRGHRHG
jgi:Fe2+ transport system protein FeoA